MITLTLKIIEISLNIISYILL